MYMFPGAVAWMQISEVFFFSEINANVNYSHYHYYAQQISKSITNLWGYQGEICPVHVVEIQNVVQSGEYLEDKNICYISFATSHAY
jgi:hypothetical protein